MKKTLAMILALVMLLALSVPCFAEEAKNTTGMLAKMNITEEELNATRGMDDVFSGGMKYVFFDTLGSLLLALESGKIDRISLLPSCVTEYIAKTNDKFVSSATTNDKFVSSSARPLSASYSFDSAFAMGTLSENTEVYDLLNSSIETLKENGTLEKLQKEYIDDLIESGEEPAAVEFLPIDGAKTIKVAVMGDYPPVDYVAADGTPAGFNVALLSEISKLANVNIELVQVNSASRLLALTQGTVDAVFCFLDYVAKGENAKDLVESTDIPEAVSVTAAYYTTPNYSLALK